MQALSCEEPKTLCARQAQRCSTAPGPLALCTPSIPLPAHLCPGPTAFSPRCSGGSPATNPPAGSTAWDSSQFSPPASALDRDLSQPAVWPLVSDRRTDHSVGHPGRCLGRAQVRPPKPRSPSSAHGSDGIAESPTSPRKDVPLAHQPPIHPLTAPFRTPPSPPHQLTHLIRIRLSLLWRRLGPR
jgi:hypothetical protein